MGESSDQELHLGMFIDHGRLQAWSEFQKLEIKTILLQITYKIIPKDYEQN